MLYQDKTIVTEITDMVFKNFNFEKSELFSPTSLYFLLEILYIRKWIMAKSFNFILILFSFFNPFIKDDDAALCSTA